MPSISNLLTQKPTPLIKIPEKSSGVFGSALGNNQLPGAPAAKKTYDMSQYGVSRVPAAPVVQSSTGTAPRTSGVSSPSTGSYKGVPLYGADQAGLQKQMADIDGRSSTPLVEIPKKKVTTTPATAPIKGLLDFNSLVGGLAGASTPNKTQTDLISALQTAAAGNTAIGQDARAISQKYADEINRVGQLGAGAEAGYRSSGSNVVGAGNAAIASQSVSQRMSALSEAQQAALQGTGQQLTGQAQLSNSLNQALSGANAQQSAGITGFGTAAGLASPSVAGFGQTTFNPLTGGFSGGGGNLDPQTAANSLANEVKAGRMTYEQAVQSLGYAGGAGQQFLNSALQGSGFNAPLSSATIAGQQSVYETIPGLQAAETKAEGVKMTIDNYLDENPQLNQANSVPQNVIDQWLAGNITADPKYRTLINYLNEYTNSLAPILGVGGEPTNLKTEIAASFLDARASGKSIKEVLQNMDALSKSAIQNLRTGATYQPANVSGNSTGASAASSGGLFGW